MDFKSVDTWLATQPWLPRLKWAFVYLGDAYIDVFNMLQDKLFGKHSKAASHAIGLFLLLIVWLWPGYYFG